MCCLSASPGRTLRRICGAKTCVRGRDYEWGPRMQSPIGSADTSGFGKFGVVGLSSSLNPKPAPGYLGPGGSAWSARRCTGGRR